MKSSWTDYAPPDPKEIVRSTAALLQLTKTLKQWGKIAKITEKRGPYCGEPIDKVVRALLNLGLLPKGVAEPIAIQHFREWQSWLKILHDTFRGFETLKVDMGDLLSGKDTGVPLLEDMWKNLSDRLAKEDGGYLAAYRKAYQLAQRDGYLGKLYSATGAYSKVAKGLYYSRRRRDLNLALVINNPLACNLEYINQRRLARTDTDFLALVPREAQTDDYIAVLDGGAVPFVVRQKGDRWELLGSESFYFLYIHSELFCKFGSKIKVCISWSLIELIAVTLAKVLSQ